MLKRRGEVPSGAAKTVAVPESEASSEDAAADPLTGTVLHGTYVVGRVLGEGGMGRVYEARHTRVPQKRFAVKVLLPEFAANPNIRARFRREVEAVASISHPGVVGIFDVGESQQGWPYMVCEHLAGTDLNSFIKRHGRLGAPSVVHIGRRVSEALEATHAQGVIHRDLKPHNVFLVGDFGGKAPERPLVKLLDFGLSRFVDSDDQLTKTGVVMGTPAYMAPEQAHGLLTDHRTDVYGVGVILYTAATGQPPFDEETPQMTVLAVMSREPPRPRAITPAIPEALEIVIQRAMAKNPDDRYRDIPALRAALAKLERNPPSLVPPAAHDAEEDDAGIARARLVLLFLGMFAFVAGSAAMAAAGLYRLTGERFTLSTTELILLAALAATAVPPSFLLLRRFHRKVWGNTAKVAAWLPKLRAPLFTGLFAYGVAAFVVRFGDEVLGRFALGPPLGANGGVAWPGFDVILPLIALASAAIASVLLRWRATRRGFGRRVLRPLLTAGLVAAAAAALLSGLRLRGAAEPLTLRAEAPPAVSPSAAALPPPAASSAGVTKPPPAAAPPRRAPDDALAAAVARGVDGLGPLSEKYPNDPEVLKALVLAHASRASELPQAVLAIKRLLSAAPDQRRDADVRYIVAKAAEDKGPAAAAAFDVMSRDMGTAGPDLLYDLMLRKPAIAAEARAALAELRARAQFSPALAIAYDLRFARGCAARLGLLERAEKLGDERSLTVLSSLASKPPKCGRRGRPPCKARCEAEAKAFLTSVESISTRLRASRQAE
jgi:serine/threonine-protein kinase